MKNLKSRILNSAREGTFYCIEVLRAKFKFCKYFLLFFARKKKIENEN